MDVYTDGKLDEEKVWRWISSYKEGDRVEIMDPPTPLDRPALYGTVERSADRDHGDKSILVLLDGLETPLRFYASQLQRNPREPVVERSAFQRLENWFRGRGKG